MELRRYLDFLQRRWWLLLLGAMIAGIVGLLVSLQLPETYRAHATLLVLAQSQQPQNAAPNESLADERLTNTYAQLVERRPVFAEVRQRLGLTASEEQLDKKVSTSVIEDTQIIRVTAQDSNGDRAAELANTVARVFADLPQFDEAIDVSIINEATAPDSPASPNVPLNTAIAAILGLLVAGIIAVALEFLDDSVKTPEGVEALVGLPTLGLIPRFDAGATNGAPSTLPARVDTRFGEHYRELRTNVQFARAERGLNTLLIAGGGAHEGRSTTAASLAIVFAQAGEQVILIDGDLRRPSLEKIFFGSEITGGLSAALKEGLDPLSALADTGVTNLKLLPAGSAVPHPSELLASAGLEWVLETLRGHADLIIIDSPPLSATTDAGLLAARADATLVVVEAGATRSDALRFVTLALGRARARVIGVVLNKTRPDPNTEDYPAREPLAPRVKGRAVAIQERLRGLVPGARSAADANAQRGDGRGDWI